MHKGGPGQDHLRDGRPRLADPHQVPGPARRQRPRDRAAPRARTRCATTSRPSRSSGSSAASRRSPTSPSSTRPPYARCSRSSPTGWCAPSRGRTERVVPRRRVPCARAPRVAAAAPVPTAAAAPRVRRPRYAARLAPVALGAARRARRGSAGHGRARRAARRGRRRRRRGPRRPPADDVDVDRRTSDLRRIDIGVPGRARAVPLLGRLRRPEPEGLLPSPPASRGCNGSSRTWPTSGAGRPPRAARASVLRILCSARLSDGSRIQLGYYQWGSVRAGAAFYDAQALARTDGARFPRMDRRRRRHPEVGAALRRRAVQPDRDPPCERAGRLRRTCGGFSRGRPTRSGASRWAECPAPPVDCCRARGRRPDRCP